MTVAMPSSPLSNEACILCGSLELIERLSFPSFRRATSDIKPWPAGGRIACCRACGTVQKPRDQRWHSEAADIYAQYTMFHQTDSDDQLVFEAASGDAEFRARRIFARLSQEVALPAAGRLLDIGTGRGAALHAMGQRLPEWRSVGHDIGTLDRAHLASIARVEALHSGSIADLPGEFDLITMLHVLEHVPTPIELLAAASSKLAPAARILIQVPDLRHNPFDLLVADHCSHFDRASLAHCLALAGLEIEHIADDWVPKELSVVARPASSNPDARRADPSGGGAMLDSALAWLDRTRREAQALAAGSGRLGIFGTTVNGIWLAGELPGGPACFVDEDPGRVGRQLLGHPIIAPSSIVPPMDVFLPFLPATASAIAKRLTRAGIRYHYPLSGPDMLSMT